MLRSLKSDLTFNKSFQVLSILLFLTFLLPSCNGNESESASYETVPISSSLSEAVKKYSEVREFHDGVAIVADGNRYGLIDTLGNEVVPCKYIGLSWNAPGYYTTYVSNGSYSSSRSGLVDKKGNRLTQDTYKEIVYLPDFGLITTYAPNAPQRYFNLEGEEVTPAFVNKQAVRKAESKGELTHATPFYNGLSMVTYYNRPSQDYYCRMINDKGEIVMSVTEKNGKFGVEDMNGKEIVPHQYASIEDYDDGYLLVSDGHNRYGLWSLPEGKQTVEPKYNVHSDGSILGEFNRTNPVHTFMREGYLMVSAPGKGYSLVRPSDGKEFDVPELDIRGFDILPDNRIRVSVADEDDVLFNAAIYDFDGKKIIDINKWIADGPDGYTVRKVIEGKGTSYGAFTLSGKKIVDVENAKVGEVSEGLVAVQKEKDGKFGFVDLKGNYVIEPKYDRAGYFNGGLAPVMKDGHWGYVNRIGEDTFGE